MLPFPLRTSNGAISDILKEIESQSVQPKLKPRIQPKDYTRENIVRIRQLSATKKQNENEATSKVQPLKGDWKKIPVKYENVSAKISTFRSKDETNLNSLLSIPKRRQSVESIPPLNLNNDRENREPNYRPIVQKSTLVSRPPSVSKLNLEETSHVKHNATNSKFTRLKRSNSASDLNDKFRANYQPGLVPRYLIERKKQIMAEKLDTEMKKKEMSPGFDGHTIMPDEERLETLKAMKENERELLQRLSLLPIRSDTLRVRQMKDQIDQQLAKIEEGIKIFSRSKVLIKIDS